MMNLDVRKSLGLTTIFIVLLSATNTFFPISAEVNIATGSLEVMMILWLLRSDTAWFCEVFLVLAIGAYCGYNTHLGLKWSCVIESIYIFIRLWSRSISSSSQNISPPSNNLNKSNELIPITFLSIFAAFLYTGSSLISSNVHRLAVLLRSYDFVAHSYIVRFLSVCGRASHVPTCKMRENDYFLHYPNGWHSFFAQIFAPALRSTSTYLLTFGVILLLTFGISLFLILVASSKIIGLERNSPVLRNWSFFITVGVVPFMFYQGYPNYIFSIALIFYSVFLFDQKKPISAGLFLLFAAESWSFLFLPLAPSMFLIAYFHRKELGKRYLSILTIFTFATTQFVIQSFTGNHSAASVTLVKSGHWPEPIFITLATVSYLFWRRKVDDYSELYLINLGLSGFQLLFFIYCIANGQSGSYYLYKCAIINLMTLALLIFRDEYRGSTLNTRFFDEYQFDLSQKMGILGFQLSFRGRTRRLAINFVILVGSMIFMFPNFLSPGLLRNARANFGYPSPVSSMLRTWAPESAVSARSKSIISAENASQPYDEVIFDEKTYWYQSTQWLNNLNMSWGTDIQSRIDELMQLNSNSKEIKNFTPLSQKSKDLSVSLLTQNSQCEHLNTVGVFTRCRFIK